MEVREFIGDNIVELAYEVSQFVGCTEDFVRDSLLSDRPSDAAISKKRWIERYQQRVAKITLHC